MNGDVTTIHGDVLFSDGNIDKVTEVRGALSPFETMFIVPFEIENS